MPLHSFSSAVKTTLTLLAVAALVVASSLGVQAQPFSPAQTAATLSILNFANGETVRYDLPLLKGTAPGASTVQIESAGSTVTWRVNGAGSWRAFVPLVQGDNEIRLTTSLGSRYRFHLTYTPQDNPYVLRLVYPMGSDSPGTFDAPAGAPHAVSNAQRRLQLTGRMLQSLTAELLYEQGQPRRTFRLLTNADGSPVVDTPRSPLTVAQLRSMEGIDLWNHFYDLFGSLPNRDKTIDVAVMADTHFDAGTGTPLAHTALGGGPLALFGGGTLYSYAETVDEIEPHFLDTHAIEQGLFPEYGRRAEYWATYTTSIGAILHEVGHTFGLPHPDVPTSGDIMWRGFDYLNRAAVTSEPYHGDVNPLVDIMPQWTAADVATLNANAWLNSGSGGGGSGGPLPETAVTSITRSGGSPTNSTTVAWKVVFVSPVTGLSAPNFTLVPPAGVVSASITGVSGSGTNWTVTATTGGDGNIGLNLVNTTGLDKALSNLPFTGEVYTVDTRAPDTQIDSGPSSPTNSTNATFTFSGVDGASGVTTFRCSIDGGAFGPCTSPQSYSDRFDGSHSFQVRAVDAAGNVDPTPAAYSWFVDTSVPDTQIDSGPPAPSESNSATFTFSGVDAGVSVLTFRCSLDGAPFGTCTSPQSYSGLADGSHYFQVRAVDAAGNVDPTPAAYSWFVDISVPDTQIDSRPPDPSNTDAATFTFSGTDSGSGVGGFACSLDATAFAACTSPQSYSGLADGAHTFQVRAVDASGNVDPIPAVYSWIVNTIMPDTTPPDTTIDSGPPDPSNTDAATFTFNGTDGGSGVAAFECKLDAAAFSVCTSPQGYNGILRGSHTFQVRAIDAANNVDPAPAIYTWTYVTGSALEDRLYLPFLERQE